MTLSSARLRAHLAAGLLALVGCSGPVAFRGKLIGLSEPSNDAGSKATNGSDAISHERESVRRELLASNDPYLKCHFWDGSLIVLEEWRVRGNDVIGRGIKYDSRRVVIERSEYRVPIASVALFETNRPEAIKSARIPVMATVATTSLALTALCITTPKACFGSCPTIYATNGASSVLQAEGFSSSIAKALEATDVDALYEVPPNWQKPELRITNEAPETHAIRSVDLRYAPRPKEGRVYRSGNQFLLSGPERKPTRCSSDTGDCLASVREAEGIEYKSNTDGEDLSSKEALLLEFPAASAGRLGLVLTSRNTLLNTYLFYQALAYMGRDWGRYLAFIERGDETALRGSRRLGELLGGVRVDIESSKGNWITAGEHFEIGPLARETVVIELPSTPREKREPLRIRLTMTRGNVRLDHVALVPIVGGIEPLRLRPQMVLRDQKPDPEALSLLLDEDRYLVTFPGDEYVVQYPDVGCDDCEWFVESRGYYYEWMREVWLPEQDPLRLAQLLLDPERAMQALAPAYRTIEPEIEQIFWQSRIAIGHQVAAEAK